MNYFEMRLKVLSMNSTLCAEQFELAAILKKAVDTGDGALMASVQGRCDALNAAVDRGIKDLLTGD